MTKHATGDAVGWVPQACTLPTVDRPVRVAELADLLARTRLVHHDVRHVVLDVPADLAGETADLAARESSCCTFFTFTLTIADGRIRLEVAVDPTHADVLDALAAQALGRPTGTVS